MRHKLLAAGFAALALAGSAAAFQDPPAEPSAATEATTAAQPSEAELAEEARLKSEADARYERMQAEIQAFTEARRRQQEEYERGIRDAEAARQQHELDMARHNAELERLRLEREAYDRRMQEYEAQYGDRGRRASRGRDRNDAGSGSATGARADDRDAAETADRTTQSRVQSDREVRREPVASGESCERQQRRNRNRGRAIGGLIGGIAAATGLADDLGPGGLALVPVGALLGDAIASLLDCDEQQQAAAATERAVAGGVGTTETWTSETRPGVSGSSTVLALEPEAGGGECMTVTDVVIVDGEETRSPKRLCRQPPSNRFVRV